MLIIIGIITSIIVFSIIILIHEYGHFKTARIFGVKVEEFGLGIPPKAKKIFTDKKGTDYTLNWLPLGGFVRLKGESVNTFNVYDENKKSYNNEKLEQDIKNGKKIFDYKGNELNEEEKNAILKKLLENYSDDSLITKAAWKQAIIVLAGIFMNFLLAAFIFAILFFIGVSPIGVNTQIKTNLDLKLIPNEKDALELGLLIEKPGVYLLPLEDSLAKKAGFLEYDLATKVNNEEIKNFESFKEIIEKNAGNNLDITVKRAINCDITKNQNCEFNDVNIQITPSNDGKIGAYLSQNIEFNRDFEYKYGFFESIGAGIKETYNHVILTFQGLKTLLGKIINPETPDERKEAIKQVSGPIGVVDFMTKSIGNGIIFILIIGAIISINLGVFNLLPIPALDGGRFIFIIINGLILKIFGKKAISEGLEGMIHVGFFIMLILLSILIAYNDILKIIN